MKLQELCAQGKSTKSARLCARVRALKKHESMLSLGGGAPEKLPDLPFFRLPESR